MVSNVTIERVEYSQDGQVMYRIKKGPKKSDVIVVHYCTCTVERWHGKVSFDQQREKEKKHMDRLVNV